MALPREISLSDEQIDEIMLSEWNLRVATLGPGSRINLTPMWFGWAGGAVYFYGRGQKVVNLRRNPACTIIVDRHVRFPELQGIMLQGSARVLEDAATEAADPHLEAVQLQSEVQRRPRPAGGSGSRPVCRDRARSQPPLGGARARACDQLGQSQALESRAVITNVFAMRARRG